MEQILVMSQSVAVILVAVPLIEAARKYLVASALMKSFAVGTLFLLVGVILMLNPILSIDGIRVDSRGAVIAVAAAFYGPACVVVVMGLATLRFLLGGIGALPGILAMAMVAVASLALWYRMSRWNVRVTHWHMVLYAAIAVATPAIVALFVPGMTQSLWLNAVAAFGPASFVAVLIPGMILLRDRERSRALAERNDKQAQLDNIAENAPTILFEIDFDAKDRPRFAYVSNASSQMLGLAPDALVGNFGAFGAMLPDASRTAIRSLVGPSAAAGTSWTFETEATRADRLALSLQIAAKARLNAEGNLVWDGTIVDMTEQRKIERMKADFVAVVSHELKTPVTAIRGSLGLISGAAVGEPNPRIAQLVAVAERNAERLMLLVNDIVEMQRLQTETLRLTIATHAVRPLLERAVAAARVHASDKGVAVILDDDVPDAAIEVDPERLQQILGNLLSNAIKFSPAGSVVIVSCAGRDGWLRLTVRDDGPGIPEAFRPRIFDAFTQADPPGTRSAGGTGLGLKITRTLVEELGGRIRFEPTDGGGTTFHVDLPHEARGTDRASPDAAPPDPTA